MEAIDPFKAEEAFREKLREAGLVPPNGIVADGKLHRIDVDDEKPGKKSGFYVYHADGIPAGAWGDWHDGKEAWNTWCFCERSQMSREEYQEHKRRLDIARAARAKEELERKAEARARAQRIWDSATPCESHPYLTRKGVSPHCLREAGGRLVIPIRDQAGDLHSIEFIDSEGNKLFLSGGRKAGCWFELGEASSVLCVAEGYATAASIHEATGLFVAVAFDCGNLLPVAKALRQKHPKAKIIICADDDRKDPTKNHGTEAAGKAAAAVAGMVAIPDLPTGGDFNDQHAIKGLESVDQTIQSVIDSDDGPIHASDLFSRVYREIEDRKNGKSKHSIGFGIESVDRLTGGMRRGMITIIAGLPGSGKTAAAIGAIVHNATKGIPCLLFSIEMDRIEIGARFVSQNCGIPAFNMLDQNRPFHKEDFDTVLESCGRLGQMSLILDDRPVTMAQIEEQTHLWFASEVRAKGKEIGLVAVDYLGLIGNEEPGESRNREVAMLAQGFKRLVRKLRVCGLMLAQLNRMAARREGEPELSDLRDSGEIEAAGDLILFPYQWPRTENAYGELVMKPPKDNNEEAADRWLCKKNKNGPKGAARVMWHPTTMRYTGVAREKDAPIPNWQDGREE